MPNEIIMYSKNFDEIKRISLEKEIQDFIIENNKLIFTNKDLNIEGNLKNIADIQAKNNIEINSKNIENAGLIVADKKTHINSDNINNTNKLVAKDTLDINNKTLTNSGKILSGKETKIVNQSLNNSGDITSSGKSDLKVRNLTNDGNILSVGNSEEATSDLSIEELEKNLISDWNISNIEKFSASFSELKELFSNDDKDSFLELFDKTLEVNEDDN